ncbi:MAG: 4-diphosphocytidyl-2-C-methyl-D-erythritol kinase [Planctomycetota bacterium]
MQNVTRFSPAKINLTLAVGPVRPDGFHPLESIVSQLDFGDRVNLTARPDGRIVVECDAAGIPIDQTNLAARAALRLREEIVNSLERDVPGVTIRLDKSIPAGAGLGGGSSNAAATLLGLRRLWNVDIPASRIAAIGAEIGSDVPLFLTDPERLIVMRGRGGQIELLGHALISTPVLLAIPPIHSPTGAVYRRFDELAPPPTRPSAREVLAHIEAERRPSAAFPTSVFGAGDEFNPARAPVAWTRLGDPSSSAGMLARLALFNDLQVAAEDLNPGLRDFREATERIAGQNFLMTGSGAAYFTLYSPRDSVQAKMTRSRLESANSAAKFILTKMI